MEGEKRTLPNMVITIFGNCGLKRDLNTN